MPHGRRALLLSLIFHAAAVGGLVLVAYRRLEIPPRGGYEFQVLLAPTPLPASAKRRVETGRLAGSDESAAAGIRLGRVHRGFRAEILGGGAEGRTGTSGDPGAAEIFRTMSPGREALLHPVLRVLHARIDEGLVYPGELFENGVAGPVELEIEVDHRGTLTSRGARVVHAESPYLAVYAKRLAERKLAEPLVAELEFPGERLRLMAHFDFVVVGHERELPPFGARALRNSLRFRRHRIRPKFLVQAYSDPLTGESAAVLDVIGFASWIGGLFSGDGLQRDPRLARYRDDPEF